MLSIRHTWIAILAAIVLIAGVQLSSCGGGGNGPDLDNADQDNSGQQNDRYSTTIDGFSVKLIDDPERPYDAELFECFDVDLTTDEAGTTCFDVNVVDASNIETAYYQITWPESEYILVDVLSGGFFEDQALLGAAISDTGILDVGHVRLNFQDQGGVSGSGTLSRFVFVQGNGDRQTSVAVDNQAYTGTGYDEDNEYVSIFNDDGLRTYGTRVTLFDGVGNGSLGYGQDGVMPQAVDNNLLEDVPDAYFDPDTFMVNIITYLPGDCDFNGEVSIYDLTPIGMYYGGMFNSGVNGFHDPHVTEFQDEHDHFQSNKALYSYYFLKWLDGDFDRVIDYSAGSLLSPTDDVYPIMGYRRDALSHFGQIAESYYMVVSSDDDLAGLMYTPNANDNIIMFTPPCIDPPTPTYTVREYESSVVSPEDGYGYSVFKNAPYYSDETETQGWPTEYTAIIEPDTLEAWGTSTTKTNGSWDPPTSPYYLYFGTYDTDAGTPSYGVLTPLGTYASRTWDLSDMYADSEWNGSYCPKMFPRVGASQELELSDLRKNFAYSSSPGELTVTRDDYYESLLDDYDWLGSPFGASMYRADDTWRFSLKYPTAFDISGVNYEIFVAEDTVYEGGLQSDSFFTDATECTLKTGVDQYWVNDTYNAGVFAIEGYNKSALGNNTKYYLMVRPVDDAGNYPGDDIGESWDEEDMTTSLTTLGGSDTFAPLFTGLTSVTPTSNSCEVRLRYPEADDSPYNSYPIQYRYIYARVADYGSVQEFIDDWDVNLIPEVAETQTGTSKFIGQYLLNGLDGGEAYYFLMRASDSATPTSNTDSNTNVKQTTPLANSAPDWVTTTGTQNVLENGTGSVKVYFNDANDIERDNVLYRVVYGSRSDFDDEEDFWDEYEGAQTGISTTSWIAEGSLLSETNAGGYLYYIPVTGLTDETVYWFGVRARDDATPSSEEENRVVVGCRPSAYSWEVLDNSCFTGFFPDIAAFDYSSGTETRLGVSYLTNARQASRDLDILGNHNCQDVRYIYYDTVADDWSTPVVVRDYSEANVSFGETSITYLEDQEDPAIIYYANSDTIIADQQEDGDDYNNPVTEDPVTGETGKKGSASGWYSALQYSEYRDTAWWHDTVDTVQAPSMYFPGAANGITSYTWEHPDGNTRTSPVVSYSQATALDGPYKCRALVWEDDDAWIWRPFNWKDNAGDEYKYSGNAEVLYLGAGVSVYGTDIIVNDDSGVDNFYLGISHDLVPMDNYDGSYFGIVTLSSVQLLDLTYGWLFRDSDPDTWSVQHWNTVINRGDWYLQTSSQTAASQIDEKGFGYKMAAYDTGASNGYGTFIVDTNGPYYIEDDENTFTRIESADLSLTQQTKYLTTIDYTRPLPIQVGLAYDSNGNPGVVYPIWEDNGDLDDDDIEDGWVLRVAERNSYGVWTTQNILFDDQDEFVRQGFSFEFCKIAYLNDDSWVVIYCDLNHRDFADESSATDGQKLMAIFEP